MCSSDLAKQFKRANKALRKLKTYLGRIIRDIGRNDLTGEYRAFGRVGDRDAGIGGGASGGIADSDRLKDPVTLHGLRNRDDRGLGGDLACRHVHAQLTGLVDPAQLGPNLADCAGVAFRVSRARLGLANWAFLAGLANGCCLAHPAGLAGLDQVAVQRVELHRVLAKGRRQAGAGLHVGAHVVQQPGELGVGAATPDDVEGLQQRHAGLRRECRR